MTNGAIAAPAPQPAPPDSFWGTISLRIRDVLIVLAAFGVITGLAVYVVQHYTQSKDAASILGLVIPAISTIAGAAFGVAAGAQAGAAAGNANAQAANTATEAKKSQAESARAALDRARTTMSLMTEALAQLPSPAGQTDIVVSREQAEQLDQPIRIPISYLSDAREQLAALDRQLTQIAE